MAHHSQNCMSQECGQASAFDPDVDDAMEEEIRLQLQRFNMRRHRRPETWQHDGLSKLAKDDAENCRMRWTSHHAARSCNTRSCTHSHDGTESVHLEHTDGASADHLSPWITFLHGDAQQYETTAWRDLGDQEALPLSKRRKVIEEEKYLALGACSCAVLVGLGAGFSFATPISLIPAG